MVYSCEANVLCAFEHMSVLCLPSIDVPLCWHCVVSESGRGDGGLPSVNAASVRSRSSTKESVSVATTPSEKEYASRKLARFAEVVLSHASKQVSCCLVSLERVEDPARVRSWAVCLQWCNALVFMSKMIKSNDPFKHQSECVAWHRLHTKLRFAHHHDG